MSSCATWRRSTTEKIRQKPRLELRLKQLLELLMELLALLNRSRGFSLAHKPNLPVCLSPRLEFSLFWPSLLHSFTFPGCWLTFPIPSLPLPTSHLLGGGEPQRLGSFSGGLPPRPPTSRFAPGGRPIGPGPGAGLADNDARPGAPWGSPACSPWHPPALPCPASSKEAEAEL